ncbi:hypothetical protein [Polaromonas sp.]|uniref:hypothetical protein n=1 Tax=Polaromonas sp. TaxID=1869339 RepID=UPI003BB7700B
MTALTAAARNDKVLAVLAQADAPTRTRAQVPGASQITFDAKLAQPCPGCGAPAKIEHAASRWKVLCSKNQSVLSGCSKAGHTMHSRKEAVRVWNELK